MPSTDRKFPMRVALYLRVSTSAQTVENQERELAGVAAARGWQVVATYRTRAYRAPRDAIDGPASTASGRTPLAEVRCRRGVERRPARQIARRRSDIHG